MAFATPLTFVIPYAIVGLSVIAACIAIILLVIAIIYYERKNQERSSWYRRILGGIFGGVIVGANVWNVAYGIYVFYLLFAIATGFTALPRFWIESAWILGLITVIGHAFFIPRLTIPSAFSCARSWRAALHSAYIFSVSLTVVVVLVVYALSQLVQTGLVTNNCIDCAMAVNVGFRESIIEEGNGAALLKETSYALLVGLLVQILSMLLYRFLLREPSRKKELV